MKRPMEFALGLSAGIVGFIMAVIYGELFGGEYRDATELVTILVIIGLVGAILVDSKPKIAGILMIVGSLGVLFLKMAYALSFVLFLYAGVKTLLRHHIPSTSPSE